MTTKHSKKNKQIKVFFIVFILVAIGVIIVLSKNKVFVPENMIYDNYQFETNIGGELISCQMDCTFGDGVFHEECLGFNGCVDSEFLKERTYCQEDEDCIMDVGCCFEECMNCKIDTKYCPISNKKYAAAHRFGCKNNIKCYEKEECMAFSNVKCVAHNCRIIL